MSGEGLGVNSPEFLQNKIDRLKTALDEANMLMDRQVQERDEARAQLNAVRRESVELQRKLEETVAPPSDPDVEAELRERIAELEAAQADGGELDELRARVETLQSERDAARGVLDALREERDAG